MARFLLNAAVIPGPGAYRYESCNHESARRWFQAGGFVSAVGYEETARLIRQLFQVECPVNRVMIEMEPGDEALVVRLARRVADPGAKGALNVEPEDLELGFLRRLD